MPQTRRTRKKGGFARAQKPRATCQCMDFQTQQGCQRLALQKSLFCKLHQRCPGSPQSGAEPTFDPLRYNEDPAIYKSHNCYSYSMNVLDRKLVDLCRKQGENYSCRQNFHQPGAKNGSRFALNATERRACPVVEKLIMDDNQDVEKASFYGRCPRGKSKIAMVVDPGEDYHFYRQDSDGMWSHKDGSNKVKRFDALKRPIFNPEYASRDYQWQGSDLNYEDFCGFYCVPRDHDIHLGQGGAVWMGPKAKATRSGGSRRLRRSRKAVLQMPPGQSWKGRKTLRRVAARLARYHNQ